MTSHFHTQGTVHMEPVDDFSLETYETGDDNQLQHELIPVDISSFLGVHGQPTTVYQRPTYSTIV